MVSDLLGWLDYSMCGEIALVLFCIVFVGIGLRAYFMTRQEVDHYSSIPLEDGVRRTNHVH